MNIFYLDKDPIKAAQSHCDQHVSKMILESAQLFSTAAFYLLPSHEYLAIRPRIYKPSYPSHPCNLWLRESPSLRKLEYLYTLACELDSIRQTQWNSSEHASLPVLKTCYEFLLHSPKIPILEPSWNDPPKAMPAIFKHNTKLDTVEAYRVYYVSKHRKWLSRSNKHPSGGMTWEGREIPNWFLQLAESQLVFPFEPIR